MSPFARRILLCLAGLLWVCNAFAGSYLNRATFLVNQSSSEIEYLRPRLQDRDLANLIHRLAKARLEAAQNMLVPKEVVQAHPHLLLMLENFERASDAASEGQFERFYVHYQRGRDEDRAFRSILKQLGYTLDSK